MLATAKILTSKNMNPQIKKAEYAVRGELAIRSEDLKIVSLAKYRHRRSPSWTPSA